MPVAGEYTCWFELGGLPRDQTYAISVRFGSGEERRLGHRTAWVRQMSASVVGRASGARKEVLVKSRFRHDGCDIYAWLYADHGAQTVRLRLSDTDDVEAFLASTSTTPGRSPASHRFSVVSPAYNVEKYLDDYFTSLTKQSLNFRSHLELILVDDGSTDHSPKIIRRWQKKYPKNIVYIRKENGGPASARNLGLSRVSHEWVTFIDPDDFVADDYFAAVSDAMDHHRDDPIAMVSCNLIFYLDGSNVESDAHPLRHRFASGERMISTEDLDRDVQLGVNSAFFRHDLIRGQDLAFDERVRPSFEDGHFIGRYLLSAEGSFVLSLPQARYFYRRRADQTSILNRAPWHPQTYGDKLQYGYVDLLRRATEKYGRAPSHLQNAVIYDILWHLRKVVEDAASLAFLSNEQRQRYRELLVETFSLIDVERVMDYDIYWLPFSHRVGILNLFKNVDPPRQLVAITQHDSAKNVVRVVYWSRRRAPSASFRVDGCEVTPAFSKTRGIDFLDEPFVWEHIAWVRLSGAQALTATVDGLLAELVAGDAEATTSIDLAGIRSRLATRAPSEGELLPNVRLLRQMARSPKALADFHDAWLFMDRDSSADDSAERLYRYVRREAPEINAFFILRRGSPDWTRLAADGFRLLPFNDAEHAIALLNASYLISSQADHFAAGFGQAEFGDLMRHKFVFLNHGVVRDDASHWLNTIPLDCLITSTPAEYESIVADGSPYRFTSKEVVLTGLARHDALLDGPIGDGHTVVVMPTWRSSLTGMAVGAGNERSVNKAFFESEFARRWKGFLHSERFLKAVKRAGWRAVFIPHPNIEQYLDYFDLPDAVEVRRFGEGASLQQTFRDLSLFVTDYSSKAFDIAYLQKPVVYYQFDPEVFFGGGHTIRLGYFDYERDGFGPVFHEEAELVEAVEAMLAGERADETYRLRAEQTFPFRDGKCCERILRAIRALGEPP